jgi:PAS domain-containing protein
MSVTEGYPIACEEPDWLAQMEMVLEVLNEGVIITDDSQRILFANSRFSEMTGVPRDDLSRFDPSLNFSSEEQDFLRSQSDEAFRAGHNRYSFAIPRKGGG